MNCPSRNDDITLEHPDWNQKPPFLAADLTTCEDLNGIANAREQRRARSGAGDGSDGRGDEMNYQTLPRLQPDRGAPFREGGTMVSTPETKRCMVVTTIHLPSGPPRHPLRLWGWVSWIMSVLGCSAIISALKSPEAVASFLVASKQTAQSIAKHSARSVRRSTCPTGGLGNEDAYNTPFHVGALFIILGVSFLACAFPSSPPSPQASASLAPFSSPYATSAPASFSLRPLSTSSHGLHPPRQPVPQLLLVEDYPAMPGAIALAGIFLVTIIEMRSGSVDNDDNRDPGPYPLEMAPSRGAAGSMGRTLSRIGRDEQQAGDRLAKRVDEESRAVQLHANGVVTLSPAQQHQKDILQCMMLEVGILFHSVFIGMTLSVSVGHEFVILLIAIAFHQTFEGLALGSRIASIDWPKGSLQPWMMALAYGCTTPIGQAIGLATHRLYSPNSEFGLILVGTMNALSSGLLVFAALIELLAEDSCPTRAGASFGAPSASGLPARLLWRVRMSLVGAWA
ncbi:zinc-regulated transporter 3 [Colletotrichum spaethianum]|uniref:Zinc-regulated transporter 3 n=1 Tax=Colletotrichum spaethianum TaxID=700344 RepID=A0AA37URT3_9PEZI|nr:zinc-regulated transporter 3 [Colletotrichum spaethianum]GKT51362.1 zinc-regulated transporter 3 [Colletotrichum spaethianum]